MTPEDTQLTARLQGLVARIQTACADPDTKPGFVHWSDAELIHEAVTRLDQQAETIAAAHKALSAALGLPTQKE